MSTFKSKSFLALTGSILILGFTVLFIYFSYFRDYERTDDAYVTGNILPINSQIYGFVESILVEETQNVKQGQLLITLDESDAKLAVESAKAELSDKVRYVCALIEEIQKTKNLIDAKNAVVQRANYDYNIRKNVVALGSISKEEFEHAQIALAVASAELLAETFQLKMLEAKLNNSTPYDHPTVELAKTKLKEAFLKLRRCKIYAPFDGIVSMRSVQVGKTILPEETLLVVVPLDQIWINANFKETQLKHIRIGQLVEFTADMWGKDVKFTGRIIGQNPGSGAVFAPVPPQNATGNWIKIVQRVPVRIEFDIKQLEKHPLWLGLTCNVKVDIREQNLSMVSDVQKLETPYNTNKYDTELLGYDEQIQTIINANILSP